MTKLLQILFGLVLILVLAYITFLNVSTKIKNDLLTKTKVIFSENNIRGVTADMQGEGLSVSRTLVLTGTAISNAERIRIVKLTENIEGICSIDNQIRLHPLVLKPSEVPVVPKVVTVIKTPIVKVSAESIVSESTPKELVIIENKVEPKAQMQVEKKRLETSVSSMKTTTKTPAVPVASTKMSTKVPVVPKVENKDIVVPTPVSAIAAPNVIRIEKIKLEGVK